MFFVFPSVALFALNILCFSNNLVRDPLMAASPPTKGPFSHNKSLPCTRGPFGSPCGAYAMAELGAVTYLFRALVLKAS